jgi:hypothetical protein
MTKRHRVRLEQAHAFAVNPNLPPEKREELEGLLEKVFPSNLKHPCFYCGMREATVECRSPALKVPGVARPIVMVMDRCKQCDAIMRQPWPPTEKLP